MKKIAAEFKEFISRGNVVDLAVGVIMGSAFTAIVTSLVNDVVMPVIGMLFGGLDFSNLRYVITPAVGDTAEAAVYYGNFIQTVVNFLLVSIVIFLAVKGVNRLRKKAEERKAEAAAAEEAPAETPAEIALLTEIRDLLQK